MHALVCPLVWASVARPRIQSNPVPQAPKPFSSSRPKSDAFLASGRKSRLQAWRKRLVGGLKKPRGRPGGVWWLWCGGCGEELDEETEEEAAHFVTYPLLTWVSHGMRMF